MPAITAAERLSSLASRKVNRLFRSTSEVTSALPTSLRKISRSASRCGAGGVHGWQEVSATGSKARRPGTADATATGCLAGRYRRVGPTRAAAAAAAAGGRDAPGVQLGRDGAERGLIPATIGARRVAWLQLGRRQRVPAAGLLHPPGDGEADECVQHVPLVVPPRQRLHDG